jgi:hypothetical protein
MMSRISFIYSAVIYLLGALDTFLYAAYAFSLHSLKTQGKPIVQQIEFGILIDFFGFFFHCLSVLSPFQETRFWKTIH